MGLAGKDSKETLEKTRAAMQQMAQLELDAAAQMKGQGQITENERDIIRRAASGDIALFRNEGRVFAVHDKCPHKGGPLSQGIVHGDTVTCPLHSWKIQLDSGEAIAPDIGCTRSFEVKVENGQVLLKA